MGSAGNSNPWEPFDSYRDCSLGICSRFCPQFCTLIFSPPPADDDSGGPFSPLIISVIGVLASIFILVSYYAIVTRYCKRSGGEGRGSIGEDSLDDIAHDQWRQAAAETAGLDDALIKTITVCKYRKGDGLIEGTECAVCLSEFQEMESLRLLPKCSHAFHLPCIDIWLKSHSNCPLCRANVLSLTPGPPPPPTAAAAAVSVSSYEVQPQNHLILVVDYQESDGRQSRVTDAVVSDDEENVNSVDLKQMRRSASVGAFSGGRRRLISDVVRIGEGEEDSGRRMDDSWREMGSSKVAIRRSVSVDRSIMSSTVQDIMLKDSIFIQIRSNPRKATMPEGTKQFPIKTIVVLVQENRSFDHMLGWMKSLNPEIDGVTGEESNALTAASDHLAANRIRYSNRSGFVDPDPGHSFDATYQQIFGVPWTPSSAEKTDKHSLRPTMEGFAQQAESIQKGMADVVMNGFKPESVPVYKELVSEFAVCDRWFSSIPSLTQPNRLFIHSATSYGATENDTKMMIEGYPQKTIFESMEEEGYSFGIYYQYPPSTLFYRNLRKLKHVRKFHQFDRHFKKHCKEGKLPNYVVIEQRYFETKLLPGNDDHPPHDVSEGQRFIKEVYEALRSSPQWNELLFVIIYDEHGGFYDHVPTPTVGVPSPDDIVGPEPYRFEFDRLGVRVPAILVSPWIEPGTVLHGPSGPCPTSEYEHSSIPATVKKIFNLKSFLTKRDAWAGTFECVLNRTSPRTDCPVTLPEPVKMREAEPDEDAKLSEFQEELVQLCAVLKGDDEKDPHYPHRGLRKDIRVVEAVDYIGGAFQKFMDDCATAEKDGADESHIVCAADRRPRKRVSKTFGQKLLSCFACGN